MGVLSAALKKDALSPAGFEQMIAYTTQLNTPGPALAKLDGVHALTDITGFGLAGFLRPIRLFQRVRVETTIVFADQRFAYFSHVFFVDEVQHGEVLVRMKFKKGAITVPLTNFIELGFNEKPAPLVHWDQALGACEAI